MSAIDEIRAEAERRQITRLAHFTPLRNLVHIATGQGLYSTKYLSETERAAFNPQDRERLDGYPDHISCSIEYPNAYYLRSKHRDARGEARIFPDWVCLLLAPHHLWQETTLLCRHNAAGGLGADVEAGYECFKSIFAQEVEAPQACWIRGKQPDCCPTDAQAEVLVHRHIPLEDVLAIAVASTEQAADTYARLKQLEAPVETLPFVVAPVFFTPTSLAAGLSRDQRPVESAWHPPLNGDGADEPDA